MITCRLLGLIPEVAAPIESVPLARVLNVLNLYEAIPNGSEAFSNRVSYFPFYSLT